MIKLTHLQSRCQSVQMTNIYVTQIPKRRTRKDRLYKNCGFLEEFHFQMNKQTFKRDCYQSGFIGIFSHLISHSLIMRILAVFFSILLLYSQRVQVVKVS